MCMLYMYVMVDAAARAAKQASCRCKQASQAAKIHVHVLVHDIRMNESLLQSLTVARRTG
jgi:hypothetical protein